MASQRLMSIARAAGCAMAPTVEYLDGPSQVMPRPESDFLAEQPDRSASTALTVGWTDVASTTRIRELFGNLWYGRATPA